MVVLTHREIHASCPHARRRRSRISEEDLARDASEVLINIIDVDNMPRNKDHLAANFHEQDDEPRIARLNFILSIDSHIDGQGFRPRDGRLSLKRVVDKRRNGAGVRECK